MNRPTFRVISLACLLLALASTGAWSQQQVAGRTFSCDDGAGTVRQYWLFAQGDDASCTETGTGLFECTNAAGTNESRGGCADGCGRKTGVAGCHLVLDGTHLVQGGTDLECPDGRVYRLEDGNGTCLPTNNRTSEGTAECWQGEGVSKLVTVSASCESGCGISRPGTNCKCVKGCGTPERK